MNKVSLKTRQELLDELNLVSTGVVIGRKPTDSDDIISVIMPSQDSIPQNTRIDTFKGFAVEYIVRVPPKSKTKKG